MRVGFTGTREGMTAPQKESLGKLLVDLGATELHHGDCVGADAEAHAIAKSLGLRVVIHPPSDETHRAFYQGADEVREPKTHFARNRNIVMGTDRLLGASLVDRPLPRGGTWYTINYAVGKTKPTYVIWPIGAVSRMDGQV